MLPNWQREGNDGIVRAFKVAETLMGHLYVQSIDSDRVRVYFKTPPKGWKVELWPHPGDYDRMASIVIGGVEVFGIFKSRDQPSASDLPKPVCQCGILASFTVNDVPFCTDCATVKAHNMGSATLVAVGR